MKKIIYALVVAILLAALLAGCAAPAPAPTPAPAPAPSPAPSPAPAPAPVEKVKFKAVAFLPPFLIDVAGFNIFIDMVNEEFSDYLEIELLGGPEVTPPFQLHEAVKSGVLDMAQTSPSYYPSLLWEAKGIQYTNKTRAERAETGIYDLMSQLHEDVGLVWLDSVNHAETFRLYTNIRVETPWDLAGQKIRVFPTFIPLIDALGAVPINLPIGDIYTAMERGAVDGFVMTYLGFVKDFSWHEVTKYALDYDLYAPLTSVLVNPDTWNKLPADVQQDIREFKKSVVDPAIEEFFTSESAATWQLVLDAGVEPITFSPSDAAAFLELAYDSGWDSIIAQSPELGPILKDMLVK